MKQVFGFVNESAPDINKVVDGFVKNLVHQNLIKSVKDVNIIYDKNTSGSDLIVNEIQIPVSKITVDDADQAIKLAEKYPAFKKNIANAFIDADKQVLRLIFIREVNEAFVNEAFKSKILSDLYKNSDANGKKIITDHANWDKNQGIAIGEITDNRFKEFSNEKNNFSDYLKQSFSSSINFKNTETIWTIDGKVVAKTGTDENLNSRIINNNIDKSKSALELIEKLKYEPTAKAYMYSTDEYFGNVNRTTKRNRGFIEPARVQLSQSEKLALLSNDPGLMTAIKQSRMKAYNASIDRSTQKYSLTNTANRLLDEINKIEFYGSKLSIEYKHVRFCTDEAENDLIIEINFTSSNNGNKDGYYHSGSIGINLSNLKNPLVTVYRPNKSLLSDTTPGIVTSYDISMMDNNGRKTNLKYVADIKKFAKTVANLSMSKTLVNQHNQYVADNMSVNEPEQKKTDTPEIVQKYKDFLINLCKSATGISIGVDVTTDKYRIRPIGASSISEYRKQDKIVIAWLNKDILSKYNESVKYSTDGSPWIRTNIKLSDFAVNESKSDTVNEDNNYLNESKYEVVESPSYDAPEYLILKDVSKSDAVKLAKKFSITDPTNANDGDTVESVNKMKDSETEDISFTSTLGYAKAQMFISATGKGTWNLYFVEKQKHLISDYVNESIEVNEAVVDRDNGFDVNSNYKKIEMFGIKPIRIIHAEESNDYRHTGMNVTSALLPDINKLKDKASKIITASPKEIMFVNKNGAPIALFKLENTIHDNGDIISYQSAKMMSQSLHINIIFKSIKDADTAFENLRNALHNNVNESASHINEAKLPTELIELIEFCKVLKRWYDGQINSVECAALLTDMTLSMKLDYMQKSEWPKKIKEISKMSKPDSITSSGSIWAYFTDLDSEDLMDQYGEDEVDLAVNALKKIERQKFVNESKDDLKTEQTIWSKVQPGDIISADGEPANDELSEVVLVNSTKQLKIVKLGKNSNMKLGSIFDPKFRSSDFVWIVSNYINESRGADLLDRNPSRFDGDELSNNNGKYLAKLIERAKPNWCTAIVDEASKSKYIKTFGGRDGSTRYSLHDVAYKSFGGIPKVNALIVQLANSSVANRIKNDKSMISLLSTINFTMSIDSDNITVLFYAKSNSHDQYLIGDERYFKLCKILHRILESLDPKSVKSVDDKFKYDSKLNDFVFESLYTESSVNESVSEDKYLHSNKEPKIGDKVIIYQGLSTMEHSELKVTDISKDKKVITVYNEVTGERFKEPTNSFILESASFSRSEAIKTLLVGEEYDMLTLAKMSDNELSELVTESRYDTLSEIESKNLIKFFNDFGIDILKYRRAMTSNLKPGANIPIDDYRHSIVTVGKSILSPELLLVVKDAQVAIWLGKSRSGYIKVSIETFFKLFNGDALKTSLTEYTFNEDCSEYKVS